nr:hypothetical protein [uncultured Tolumonas sp.]
MNNSYLKQVKYIKNTLRQYTDDSFISVMLAIFNESNQKTDFLQRLPWAFFLTYKWKLIEPNGKTNIDRNNLVEIIDKVHSLQSYASNLKSEGQINLKIRPLLINQALYQVPFAEQIHSIFRQYHWFTNGDKYFSIEFERLTSLAISDFYKISYWFIVLASGYNKQSITVSLSDVLVNLHPMFSIQTIINYLQFTACTKNELRGYALQHNKPESPSWEYFSDTPFIYKPLLIQNNKVTIYNKYLLNESLSNLAPETLKFHLKEAFKSKLSIEMELYMQTMFKRYNLNFITEENIRGIYSKKSIQQSKVVDFIIKEENCNIYIDAKAIEPSIVVKTESNPETLRKRLADSFIKGAIQTQCCAKSLIQSGVLHKNEQDIALIVLHKDHFIANADDLIKDIDTDLPRRIREQNEEIFINLSRTYYITIDDLELFIEYCSVNNISIGEVMNKFSKDDMNPATKKYIFSMHLQNIDGNSGKLYSDLQLVLDEFSTSLEKSYKNKNKFWSNKISYYQNCISRIIAAFT